MTMEIIYILFKIIIFFIPGSLLSLLIFKNSNYLERVITAILLSGAISCFAGFILGLLKRFNEPNIFLLLTLISWILAIIFLILSKNNKFITLYSQGFWNIIGLAIIGTAWRLYLVKVVFKNYGDAYAYASKIIENSILKTDSFDIKIPEINFYKGMVIGHLDYFGSSISGLTWNFIGMPSLLKTTLLIFLGMVVYIGFTFIITQAISGNKNLSYLASFLMVIGPIELWHSTLGFAGHSLAYFSLFSLFLLFKRKEFKYFIFTLLISCAAILSYYTSAVAIIILCSGFIIASIFSYFILNRKNKDKKNIKSLFTEIIFFTIIAAISSFFVLGVSHTSSFTTENFSSAISYVKNTGIQATQTVLKTQITTDNNQLLPTPTPNFIPAAPKHYTGPLNIFGFPVIAIEDIIFIFCGLTFIIYLIFNKTKTEGDIFALLCCIPVSMLSLAFIYINYYERVLYYFAFFTIAVLKIPKKIFPFFAVFLILSTIFFAWARIYQRPYLTTNDTEIEAAKFATQNLEGTIFTDQFFANVLITNQYYNVQGISDNSPMNSPIYRQQDSTNATIALKKLNAQYIAITKRMRDIYILDLNFPQTKMENSAMYEQNFLKVYDNGDVRIYQID